MQCSFLAGDINTSISYDLDQLSGRCLINTVSWQNKRLTVYLCPVRPAFDPSTPPENIYIYIYFTYCLLFGCPRQLWLDLLCAFVAEAVFTNISFVLDQLSGRYLKIPVSWQNKGLTAYLFSSGLHLTLNPSLKIDDLT